MSLRTTTVVVAILLTGSHVASAHAGTSVRGQARTCRDYADLDYAPERALLDERIADMDENPGNQSTWEEVKARLAARKSDTSNRAQ